jgi:hypothetical protein
MCYGIYCKCCQNAETSFCSSENGVDLKLEKQKQWKLHILSVQISLSLILASVLHLPWTLFLMHLTLYEN